MEENGSQIDEQLADYIDAQAVDHLRDLVVSHIQRECEVQEASMAAAWQTIQDSISAVHRKKQVIYSTLKAKESLERAQRVFDDEIQNMMPDTYKKIEKAIQKQAEKDHLPSPVVSPRLGRLDDFDRRSFTLEASLAKPHETLLPTMGPTRVDGPVEFSVGENIPITTPSKRKKHPEPSTPSSAKKSRQSNICQQNAASCLEHTAEVQPTITLDKDRRVPTFEVEARDYLFQDPKVGKDWLCVRCSWDNPFGAVHFAQHPYESGCAMEHFNKKGAKCHDSSRSYTWDDILKEFAIRDLDENWVKTSNAQAIEKVVAKTPKGKGKAKGKQSAFSPANRKPVGSSHVPEADMSLGDKA